jgi:hypothetical protein
MLPLDHGQQRIGQLEAGLGDPRIGVRVVCVKSLRQ